MRMLVKRALRQAGYGDHETVEAEDGVAALELIRGVGVDVVFCDWNMPRMAGLELLRTLRREGDQRLFGFITSESDQSMRGIAEAEGAQFVITKPFDATTFESVLGGISPVLPGVAPQLGLPAVRHLQTILETLIGRRVEARESRSSVAARQAAIAWTYVFRDGRLAAAGALDLPLAAALATGFGMMPRTRMNEALLAGRLSEDLMENLREVLNVLVGLYSPITDQRISLGDVFADGLVGRPEQEAVMAVLGQPVLRLDAGVTVAGYGGGVLSLVYARR
jgi:two-component system, chemotaxis family, chemotaxis protein CheY